MDEIDQVVDNLFSQYIKPGSTSAAGSAPEPSPQAEKPPELPAVEQPPEDLFMEVSPASPEVPATQHVVPHPVALKPLPAKKTASKSAPVKKVVPPTKKRAKSVKGIKKIKLETAKMLRYLSMALKSDNWWHKLYYSHKFVRKSMYIAQVITKRKNS